MRPVNPLFPRISEKQVTFSLELKILSEGKISLENLGMRNPLFLNFISWFKKHLLNDASKYVVVSV